MPALRILLPCGMLVVAGAMPVDAVWAASTERVSISNTEAQANSFSSWPSVSADGRFVAFLSHATNLVAGDTNNRVDVFVRDRQTGTTERVNVDSAGVQANGHTNRRPVISPDGRFQKLHDSTSEGLLAGDFNGNGKQELVADFGAEGLWARKENGGWVKLNDKSPKYLAAGDLDGNGKDELIADFGNQGIKARFNNSGGFQKLHDSTSEGLVTGDFNGNGKDELVADLGDAGLWARKENGDWKKLHDKSPKRLAAGDLDSSGKDDLVADFGNEGLKVRYNNSNPWKKIHNSSTQALAVGSFD